MIEERIRRARMIGKDEIPFKLPVLSPKDKAYIENLSRILKKYSVPFTAWEQYNICIWKSCSPCMGL